MSDAHLSGAELLRWRDDGAGDRERIVAHLARCADCRQLAADLERERPAGRAAPVHFRAEDFASAGYRAGAGHGSASRTTSRIVYLAAAASIVLAALIVPTWLRNRSESVTRGAAAPVHLIRPVDATAARDVAFEWKANPGVDRVRLVVVAIDDPSKPLIDREVSGVRYEPTPEERSRLQAGRELHWFLEYRDGTGTGTSPSTRFRLR